MSERRYDREETEAIFRAAAEGTQQPPEQASSGEGLSVVELQAIGREVGIPADAVARAAAALDVRGAPSQRTLLGLPIGVTRTVVLDRRLTDDEWERLVVQLREVFNARGTTRSDGALRQWTNGNLQVLLEPTDAGHRIRLATVHGQARASIGTGLAMLAATVAMAIGAGVSGTLASATPGVAMLSIMGVGMIANGALRLPSWARLRGRQMEALAARVALPAGRPDRLAPAPDAHGSITRSE